MEWLPIDEKMPVYPQDYKEYPPILICTDKAKVFLVVPERDPKVGVCSTIYYSEIWLEEASEGAPIVSIAVAFTGMVTGNLFNCLDMTLSRLQLPK